jgi:hypothetical protein
MARVLKPGGHYAFASWDEMRFNISYDCRATGGRAAAIAGSADALSHSAWRLPHSKCLPPVLGRTLALPPLQRITP